MAHIEPGNHPPQHKFAPSNISILPVQTGAAAHGFCLIAKFNPPIPNDVHPFPDEHRDLNGDSQRHDSF